MIFLSSQSKALRADPWGLAPYVCALLGLLWALNPSVHGVFHLAGLGHQHPSYSVYSHSPATDSSLVTDAQVSSADGDRASESAGTSHQCSTSRGVAAARSNGAAGKSEREHRGGNPPGPIDEQSGGIFLSLEIESTSSVAIEVALSESLLPLELVACEEFEIFYETLIAASAPRGPPV